MRWITLSRKWLLEKAEEKDGEKWDPLGQTFLKASSSFGVWIKPAYNFPVHVYRSALSCLSLSAQRYLIDNVYKL